MGPLDSVRFRDLLSESSKKSILFVNARTPRDMGNHVLEFLKLGGLNSLACIQKLEQRIPSGGLSGMLDLHLQARSLPFFRS